MLSNSSRVVNVRGENPPVQPIELLWQSGEGLPGAWSELCLRDHGHDGGYGGGDGNRHDRVHDHGHDGYGHARGNWRN